MMTPEDDKDVQWAIEKILKDLENKDSLKTRLNAAMRMFYSKGYREGYNQGFADATWNKDQRVVAHLNRSRKIPF